VKSAERYVELAELQNGAIPRHVPPGYVWGDALTTLREQPPRVRIANLETAVTQSDDAQPKGINYRMHPDNVGCLEALGLDCCTLANNHVLDWGRAGLNETLDVLAAAGIKVVGAGATIAGAAAPAVLTPGDDARVVVHAFGCASSGVPRQWGATGSRPGVNFIDDDDDNVVERAIESFAIGVSSSDIVICSIHWGPNWGYAIDRRHRRLAHALIERGADIVFGHSSHHPKAMEIHRERLILYGCGDFLNDYEGIGPHDGHRSDLAVMYLPEVDVAGGRLAALTMVPFEIRKFRLTQAGEARRAALLRRLQAECSHFGLTIEPAVAGAMTLKL
jgi:poly-gamma-glutamate capsule biosynthesis protein CapA/YwtB (metallophosphatase superfamily)